MNTVKKIVPKVNKKQIKITQCSVNIINEHKKGDDYTLLKLILFTFAGF